MAAYVCLVYGKDDKVLAVESIDRDDDETAVKAANAVAVTHVGCRGYELWNGGKRVATSLPKAGQPSAYERFAPK